MPTVDIMIRTYRGDFPWLAHALESLSKRATGFRQTIVVAPEPDAVLLSHLTREKVMSCPVFEDDYLGQQVIKMTADLYTDADFICHFDSDSVLMDDMTPDKLIEDGKPIVFMDPYSSIECPWQPVVSEVLGWTPEYEFMRRHPFTFPRRLYRMVRRHIEGHHHRTFESYVMSRPYRSFSEFNVLGAFAWERMRDSFTWLRPGERPPLVRQFWSWGGLNDDILREIKSYLH